MSPSSIARDILRREERMRFSMLPWYTRWLYRVRQWWPR